MSIERKIARRMARAQMVQDGVQHPCGELRRCINTLQVNPGTGIKPIYGPKFSKFAANWREAAAKRHAQLTKSFGKKLQKEARSGHAYRTICPMDRFFADLR